MIGIELNCCAFWGSEAEQLELRVHELEPLIPRCWFALAAFCRVVCFLHGDLLPRKLTGDACRVEKLQEKVEELEPFVPRCEELEFCDLLECLIISILSLLYVIQLCFIDEYSATSLTCILPCSTIAVRYRTGNAHRAEELQAKVQELEPFVPRCEKAAV